MRIHSTPAILCLLALSLLALSGCGLNPGPAPSAYTLRPDLPAPASEGERTSAAIQLGINLPVTDEALDNNRVAILTDNREFRYWKDASWTSQVPELLQNWIIAAFETDGRVYASADDIAGFLADFRLSSYVREFNVISDNGSYRAVFALTCRLIDLRSGKITSSFDRRYEQTAAQNNLASVMDAFDFVTGQALKDITAWAVPLLK